MTSVTMDGVSEFIPTPAAPSRRWDAAIDFTGGVLGGIAAVYVGQPLDTVKVKMQTFPHLYKNAFTCFANTYKVEGVVRGLYAGTVPSLAAQVAENAILFMSYGLCQKAIMMLRGKSSLHQLNMGELALSGSAAGFFCSFTLCPTELVKCKLQAMREMANSGEKPITQVKHIGPYSLTRQILREEGVLGLYRGLAATLAREVPGYCFFFGSYEICRLFLTPPGKTKDDLGPLETMACGAVGGMAFWTAIFPADVVKSRVQIQGTSQGFFRILIHIAKSEGIKALYKGLGPTVARTAPATAALFLVYENTKKVLSRMVYGDALPA